MGVNKVELATGEVIIDLSKDTIIKSVLLQGYTAHDAMGNEIEGEYIPPDEIEYISDEEFENIMQEVGI